ncbi:hypothetical protein VitviT2T_019736 [Vitis vinifera]|uniref:Uncharacterized protein n=1 Tax=Vitis vinifera TaxID=29760 RepID=A0ABY9D3W2_VITVI|nr:hypothetical protein VitviT2T_019736 [Vitis vinifera]
MLRDIMGRWVLKAPNPIHVTVGGQQHKAFLGSIRGNFSVRQQRDLTIWFVDSFTALIPKWGLRPRRVDTEVDALMGFFCFLRTFSAKQSRLEVSKAKPPAAHSDPQSHSEHKLCS